MASGRHRGVRVCAQLVGNLTDQRGLEQRLVALHIDHDRLVIERKLRRGFGQAIGASGMIVTGDDGIDAVLGGRGADSPIVGGDDDAPGAARSCALRDAHHHRLAGDVGKWFAGQPRRREPRGNQNREHVRTRKRSRDRGTARHAIAGMNRFLSGSIAYSYSEGSSLRASSSSITGMPSRIG